MKKTNHLLRLFLPLAMILGLLGSQNIFAHGFVSQPGSRAYQCSTGSNTDCGAVQWEPQSVEGPDRFPEGGPADNHIASAGINHFSELDIQNGIRWSKTVITTGEIDISWHFTANHASRDFRYYLTKQNWNPNNPLSRSSFELDPFCTVDGLNQRPPIDITHTCYLPENRTGYHVLLAVWDVSDTVNSFYNVVDLVIDSNQNPSAWKDVGDIFPSVNLGVGDIVKTRAFDANGELPEYSVQWQVSDPDQGGKENWPKYFSEFVNTQSTEISAGILTDEVITPTLGKNDFFVLKESRIERIESHIEKTTPEPIEISLTGLRDQYDIESDQVMINFTLSSPQLLSIDSVILDKSNNKVAQFTGELINQLNVALTANPAEIGLHTLVISAYDKSGQTTQRTHEILFVDPGLPVDYDFVFPKNLEEYHAGIRVLASDKNIYQCKPFPYEGWCSIYSSSSNQYEPGVGSHWQDAWLKMSIQ